MRICDVHVHYIPEELAVHTTFYKGVWTQKERLYAFLQEHNIEKALLVYPSCDAHLKLGSVAEVCRIYNAALERLIKENERIVAAAIIDIADIGHSIQEIATLKEKGFKAVSLTSSHDGRFMLKELTPVFATIQESDLPVFIHPQTINPLGFERVKDPLLTPVLEYSLDSSMFMGLLMMEGVFERYAVKFIFSSLGGVVPFLRDRFDRVYTMLRRRGLVKDLGKAPSQILKNVYVDTSGSPQKNIQLAVELFGEDKILWGSDYPVNSDVGENLRMLEGFGPEVKEKIVGGNFLRIFS